MYTTYQPCLLFFFTVPVYDLSHIHTLVTLQITQREVKGQHFLGNLTCNNVVFPLYCKLKSILRYHQTSCKLRHTKVKSAATRAITLLNLHCNIAVRQAARKVLLKKEMLFNFCKTCFHPTHAVSWPHQVQVVALFNLTISIFFYWPWPKRQNCPYKNLCNFENERWRTTFLWFIDLATRQQNSWEADHLSDHVVLN